MRLVIFDLGEIDANMACQVQNGRQTTPLTENHARERKSKQFWPTGTKIDANMACHIQNGRQNTPSYWKSRARAQVEAILAYGDENRHEYGLSRPK